jgi:hypothetical protein
MTGRSLAQQMNTPEKWPTPRNNTGPSLDAKHLSLDGAVRHWPTPRASDGEKSSGMSIRWKEAGRSPDTLPLAVKTWPTPTVNGNYNRKGLSPQSGDGLATAVANFPTPCARDYRSPNLKPYSERGGGAKGEQLVNFVAHNAPAPTATGQLNPEWVEWLMDWPRGWTDLGPLNPQAFREWQAASNTESAA